MQGLSTLLGVSTIFSALAPSQNDVAYCDRYLAQQPAAIYYGDFWHLAEDGRYVYDPAVKVQFQGVIYREDKNVVTISQLKRNDSQKEIKIYLDKDKRIEKLEYRFENGTPQQNLVRTETHVFARSKDTCVPLERREEVSSNGTKDATPFSKFTSIRYNLQLCQEIKSKIAHDPGALGTRTLTNTTAQSLKESFVRHKILSTEASKNMSDSSIASQALLSLHECETTAGVKEALATARVDSQATIKR